MIIGVRLPSVLLLVLVLGGCSGTEGNATADLPETVESDSSEGVYSDVEALIRDVEDAGITCWKWFVDDDVKSPQLMGTAASASCYQSRDDMESYYGEGRIALYASTSARDSQVNFSMDEGEAELVVGPNYIVWGDGKTDLRQVANEIGAQVRGNEFKVN